MGEPQVSSEPQAPAISPETPGEGDYRDLSAALEASARGRAFLAEYAKRNRNADTERVLGALDRLGAQMRADAAAIGDLRGELRMLLNAIRLARPDIDSGRPPGKVAMLTALVDLLERRIDSMVEIKAAEAAIDQMEGTARPQLAVVPLPDEPELPIPSPFGTQAPAIAVVPASIKPRAGAAIMPEVNVFDSTSPAPAKPAIKAALKAATKSAAPKDETPAADRLKALMSITALSEDERLALFT